MKYTICLYIVLALILIIIAIIANTDNRLIPDILTVVAFIVLVAFAYLNRDVIGGGIISSLKNKYAAYKQKRADDRKEYEERKKTIDEYNAILLNNYNFKYNQYVQEYWDRFADFLVNELGLDKNDPEFKCDIQFYQIFQKTPDELCCDNVHQDKYFDRLRDMESNAYIRSMYSSSYKVNTKQVPEDIRTFQDFLQEKMKNDSNVKVISDKDLNLIYKGKLPLPEQPVKLYPGDKVERLPFYRRIDSVELCGNPSNQVINAYHDKINQEREEIRKNHLEEEFQGYVQQSNGRLENLPQNIRTRIANQFRPGLDRYLNTLSTEERKAVSEIFYPPVQYYQQSSSSWPSHSSQQETGAEAALRGATYGTLIGTAWGVADRTGVTNKVEKAFGF